MVFQFFDLEMEVEKERVIASQEIMEKFECSICVDMVCDKFVATESCRHIFCLVCLKGWLEMSKTCPICRAPNEGMRLITPWDCSVCGKTWLF